MKEYRVGLTMVWTGETHDYIFAESESEAKAAMQKIAAECPDKLRQFIKSSEHITVDEVSEVGPSLNRLKRW